MDKSNKIVNGLWVGSELSLLEMMTIKSFIAHGHQFYLWVYDSIMIDPIDELFLKDANEILPKEKVFKYKNNASNGLGKGSIAGFSDVFRYKLLYEKGGWWVDMDVTCLKPFDFVEPFVFRAHVDLPVIGNVMKCEKGSEVMRISYEIASQNVDEFNQDWLKPVKILNEQIHQFGLEKYIISDMSFPDHMGLVNILLYSEFSLPDKYYFVHWLNEKWTNERINKNSFQINSSYFDLLTENGLALGSISLKKKLGDKISLNRLKIKIYLFIIKRPNFYEFIKTLINVLSMRKNNFTGNKQEILSKELLIELGLIKK